MSHSGGRLNVYRVNTRNKTNYCTIPAQLDIADGERSSFIAATNEYTALISKLSMHCNQKPNIPVLSLISQTAVLLHASNDPLCHTFKIFVFGVVSEIISQFTPLADSAHFATES